MQKGYNCKEHCIGDVVFFKKKSEVGRYPRRHQSKSHFTKEPTSANGS